MEKDISAIITDFRALSSEVYQEISDDFRKNIQKLDRQKDENVFQLLLARYLNKLKRQLDREAEKIAGQYNRHDTATLQRELSGRVSYLISAFLLKAKSM